MDEGFTLMGEGTEKCAETFFLISAAKRPIDIGIHER
jgi:hypothetical protein